MLRQPSCPLGYTGEDLTAWQAGLQDDAATADLRRHVAGCPACQRTLAEFQRLGDALRAAPVPPAGEAVWRGLRTQIARSPRRAPPARRIVLAGAVATIAVGLLVILFVTFAAPPARPGGSTTTPIVVATRSPFPTVTPSPTPTATPLPPTAAQAWPGYTPRTVAQNLPNGSTFNAEDITPDGATLVGEILPANESQTFTDTIVALNLATGAFRTLFTFASGYNAAVKTDGRYVAWISPAVDTGGPGPNIEYAGYVDLQTGHVTQLNNGGPITIAPNGWFAVDHGYFVWQTSGFGATPTPPQLMITNMATGQSRALPGNSQGYLQLQYPYMIYYDPGTLTHLLNVQTGVDSGPNVFPASVLAANTLVTLLGTTAYWTDSQNRAFELDHIDTPGATPKQIYQIAATPADTYDTSFTSRLILWCDKNNHCFAYDRVAQRLVTLPAHIYANNYVAMPSTLGQFVIVQIGPDDQHISYAIYNTAALPG